MNLGENIKNIRTNMKMKQSELAEKSGLSRVAIGNYERGDREPNIKTLENIAKALNVTLIDIIAIDIAPKQLIVNAKDISQISTKDLIEELQKRNDFKIELICREE